MQRTLLTLVSLALGAALGAPANAFTFGEYTLSGAECDALDFGCEGSSITLGIDELGSGDYRVTLILDTTNYSGNQDGVVQAGFKAFHDYTSISLDSTPNGDSWSSPTESSINSNGGFCDDTNSPGHICTTGYTNIENPDQYIWRFIVEGGDPLAVDDWHIGFQYCNEETYEAAVQPDSRTKCSGKIISASGGGGTPVPEPSAALVFGTALLLAVPRMRRRR